MKKHILILTHGEFGNYLLQSAQMIIGETDHATAVSLYHDDSPEDFLQKVENELSQLPDDIICLVDLFGGSPCNVALRVSKDRNMQIISGLNLPMFIELYNNLDEDAEKVIEIARDSIFDVTRKFSTR
ncbi:PTS sugar transporter subunit IIA [Enterococcus sp. AZ109]|uniref:PTS sugar transporter subunit IIA n=1 Tax=Enterococcus sp. AZ109 TaxID=2774634 RepID=UPI003F200FB7